MNAEEFRRAGHALIDWIAAYREGIEAHPVRSAARPGALRDRLPAAPPEHGESLAPETLLAELDALLPALTHWQHPAFFAYFPGNASYASVLGDLAATGLGQTGITWQASPALTELEEVTVSWMRQLSGLSEAWQGVIHDTASTATLVALLCARERATAHSAARGGLIEASTPLIVYGTSESHSSIDKAVRLAGFGRAHLRMVAIDRERAMDPAALVAAIAADRAAGLAPCAIVATVGTTASTAIDPIRAIAAIAREHGLWLHVDAAMGGSAMVVPEMRHLWDGVEEADSLVMNPHKWLGVAFDCSLYFVRDAAALVNVMSTDPSYLRTAADGAVRNLRDWGIPLGRRFRALKLWLHLRAHGAEGLRARIRRDLANARWLAAEVDATPHWVRAAAVPLQTVCVRHEPPHLSGAALEQHQLEWCERLNASGAAYLTPTQLGERWVVRVSVGAERTERAHVEALWQAMRATAGEGSTSGS